MADAAILDSPASQHEPRWRVIWRNAFPFLVVAAIWEIVARAGVFPPRLFPSLEVIATAFWRFQVDHPGQLPPVPVGCDGGDWGPTSCTSQATATDVSLPEWGWGCTAEHDGWPAGHRPRIPAVCSPSAASTGSSPLSPPDPPDRLIGRIRAQTPAGRSYAYGRLRYTCLSFL